MGPTMQESFSPSPLPSSTVVLAFNSKPSAALVVVKNPQQGRAGCHGGRHSLADLPQLADNNNPNECIVMGLRMLFVTTRTRLARTPRQIVLCGLSFNVIDGQFLFEARFLNSLHTLKTFAKTPEINYGVQFVNAKTKDISKDLQHSRFLSGASMSTGFCHIRILKFGQLCPADLHSTEMEGPYLFGVTCFDDATLLSYENEDPVYLLRAAERFLVSPKQPKGELPAKPLYASAAKYLGITVFIRAIVHLNPRVSNDSGLQGFLRSKIANTRYSKTTILAIFFSAMGLFQLHQEVKKRKFDTKAQVCQKRGICRIKNAYNGSDSVSLAPALPSTLSWSSISGPAAPQSPTASEHNGPQELLAFFRIKVIRPVRKTRAREVFVSDVKEVL